jgi:hypothetical protein
MNSHVRVSRVWCERHTTPSLDTSVPARLATCLRASAIFAVDSCFCSFLFRKCYSNVFVGLGLGLGVEVKNLTWMIDEVTTILGDVRGNHINIGTLFGSAQVSHNVSETIAPTFLFFFGLPRGVASTKFSQQVSVCILVHLCQLCGSEGKEWWEREGIVSLCRLTSREKGRLLSHAPLMLVLAKCWKSQFCSGHTPAESSLGHIVPSGSILLLYVSDLNPPCTSVVNLGWKR